jgi:hypothetical protein
LFFASSLDPFEASPHTQSCISLQSESAWADALLASTQQLVAQLWAYVCMCKLMVCGVWGANPWTNRKLLVCVYAKNVCALQLVRGREEHVISFIPMLSHGFSKFENS